MDHKKGQREQRCKNKLAAEDEFRDRHLILPPALSTAQRVSTSCDAVSNLRQTQPARFRTAATMPALGLREESALVLASRVVLALESVVSSVVHRSRRNRL